MPLIASRAGGSASGFGGLRTFGAAAGAVDTGSMFPIGAVTVGNSNATTVTFSSIPATYTHLQIRCITANATSGNASSGIYYSVNSDSTNGNYKSHALYADASTVTSNANNRLMGVIGNVNGYGSYVLDILDYANTNKYTTFRSLGGFNQNGYGFVWYASGVWLNTSAVNSISFACDGGDFLKFTQFALYGIKGA